MKEYRTILPTSCSREEEEMERYHPPAGLSLVISRVNDGSLPRSGKSNGKCHPAHTAKKSELSECSLLKRKRKTISGWRNQPTGHSWNSKREKQSSAHKVEGPQAPGHAGCNWKAAWQKRTGRCGGHHVDDELALSPRSTSSQQPPGQC